MASAPSRSGVGNGRFVLRARFLVLLLLGLALYPWSVQLYTRLIVELANHVVSRFSPPVRVEILPDETVRYVETREDGTEVQTVVFGERGFAFAGIGVAILPCLILGVSRPGRSGLSRLVAGFAVLIGWQCCTAIAWAIAADYINEDPERFSADILFYALVSSPHVGVVVTWGLMVGRRLMPESKPR